ncbi:protein patched isoform X3 [Leptopilina heterotoma]|uniref:protein patched isoform X3 n=1 Tax=Leptopilina heterotoma TaxID=63436 RepID=UPI001CA80D40|nr:protein patched isoform X3 [Leptopilina heterotoma]
MTAASGPTGILAGRPSVCQSQSQNATDTKTNNNNNNNNNNNSKKLAILKSDKIRHNSDLYVRTSWTDANVALDQLEKGKAEGEKSKIWFRAYFQKELSQLGRFEHKHAGKVIFVAIVALTVFFVGIKSSQIHHKVEQLWIPQGGRLEKEMLYAAEILGEATTSTQQLVIQTPRVPGANVLQPAALLEHLEVLQVATQVTVDIYDITWKLTDFCYAPSIPNFEEHFVDEYFLLQIFERIVPCSIITPLDCFWEGSKLLGPTDPVSIGFPTTNVLKWTHLNPTRLLKEIKKMNVVFDFDTLEIYMKRAGITYGYQEKPCLNPEDSECPQSAPNKETLLPPDIGTELTGGCYGFAAKHMHWPEELVVGGAKHNKTGHITKAEALQTVVQLMGEREFYDYMNNHAKVRHIDWSQEKATKILETWQRAFSQVVQQRLHLNITEDYNHYAFSTITLNDILKKYSEVNYTAVIIGGAIIFLYVGVVLYRRGDPVRSQSGIGIGGVILVYAAEASGLGFCAIIGTPFNAVTTQTLPFLNVVLAVSDIFLLTHTYSELSMTGVHRSEQTGVILKRTGLVVFLTRLCSGVAFFSSWLIPIPALRIFALQAGILNLFGLAAIMLIFPAMMSLDLRRRRSGRSDIFCCCVPSVSTEIKIHNNKLCNVKAKQAVTRAIPPERRETCTQILTSDNQQNEYWVGGNVVEDDKCSEEDTLTGCSQDNCLRFSLTCWVREIYAPFLTKPITKVVGMVLLGLILTVSLWQATRVKDGLDLADIAPQNSDEHAFLTAQTKHFGFYSMFAVTGSDIEYPYKQKLLQDYHDAFIRVKNIIKNDNGGLPEFWLSLFRKWLQGLQAAFDKDYKKGYVNVEGWNKNASHDTIMAYKLLVQTGHVGNPIDKSLINQVRLVSSEGIINPRGFYNYLSAWASNDALAYGASQANIRPMPREWFFSIDHELKIPKSMSIVYAQMPFYLHKLTDTVEITQMIHSVRKISKRFEERGLPNFPSGIPFLFWEQYMDLRACLAYALGAALFVITIITSILLMNLWAVVLVQFYLAGVVIQLLGIMGLFNINLSAVPAVLLIVSVGISIPFVVHFCLGFVTSIGGRDRRTKLALEYSFAPVLHGGMTTLLSVMMLAFSEFDFVVRYFFLILFSAVIVGMVNGFFFFPILLSLIGPQAEIIPNEHPERISTPTPPATPIIRRIKAPSAPRRPHKIENTRVHNEPSLTTITEEPNSWHSTQESCNIIVQPEVTVETTTSSICNNQNCSGSDPNGSNTSSMPSTSHITTKVTATANIKVELHTSGIDRGDKCRHSSSSRRGARFTTNLTAESSSSSSEHDSDFSSNNKH